MEQKLDQTYIDEIRSWREKLDASIREENGWLALAGLFWLDEGQHSVGRLTDCAITLPSDNAPDLLGYFTRKDGQVFFQANEDLQVSINGQPGKGKWLESDTSPEPDFITYGDLCLVIIERGEQVGIRIWDNSREQRTSFPGRKWYPVKTEFIFEAQFIRPATSRTITIPDVLGHASEEEVIGEILFSYAGEKGQLHALEASEGRAFIIFGDRSNGDTTYPGGRFLTVETGSTDRLKLDFNRAYNPPCAFTPYATCPLPPETNRLTFSITAGERFEIEAYGH
jgi:uncharacterized protein (DUF1684 family)